MTEAHYRQRRLANVVKAIAPIPIVVGLLHVVLGLSTDVMLGAKAPVALLVDPVLDSQNRFYGAVFMGYGAMLWLCAGDLSGHKTLFRILGGSVFLGGIARVVSMMLHGLPTPPVIALTVIELVGVPLLLLWHRNVLAVGDR
jgi:Domain of unknown function (DUF4345)